MDEVFGGDKGEIQAEASIAKPTRPTVVKTGIIYYGRQITPQDVEHTESAHAKSHVQHQQNNGTIQLPAFVPAAVEQ